MIQFNEIEIEGFRSVISPFVFNLNKPGLNMLKGINGSGKTSTFEALVWGLFGTNLKETNQDSLITWAEIRPSTFAGTHVGITFIADNSTFYVSRNMKYKKEVLGVKGEDYLFLAKDGVMLGDFRNKAETQKEIQRILGVDVRTFMNSIIFAQRAIKLVESENKDKRELFETLFETEWVGNLKVKCDEDIKLWESDLLKLGYDINKSSTEIEHLTDKLSTARENVKVFEFNRGERLLGRKTELGQYNTKLADFGGEIKEYQASIDELKYDSDAHLKLGAEYEALEKQFNETQLSQANHTNKLTVAQNALNTQTFNVNKLQEDLDNLTAKHIEGNCPYCAQELKAGNQLAINHNKDLSTATEKVEKAKIARKEAETAFKALQKVKAPATPESITKAKEEVSEKLEAMNTLANEYRALQENIRDATADKVQTEKDIARVNNEIEAIKAEKPPVVDIKGIEGTIKLTELALEDLQAKKPVIEKKIEVAKWWSSKALGAGGIKAFVFSAMLNTLNQCVKKYGDRLGASLEFSIDLSKASKPFTTRCSLGDKIDKDYKDFSGGEKDRLDIVLMFSMYDLISIGTDMNLLIMDEPFAGLDEEGETIVFDLIREKADTGKSIWVISHSATLDSLYANKTEFTKVNGNTLILN
jgi:exonuclease SbcC